MDARVELPRDFPQAELSASRRSVHLPGRWTPDRLTIVFSLALLPPLAVTLAERGGFFLLPLAASLALALAWTGLFAWTRGRAMGWNAIPAAAVFALLVPPDMPLWQALMALSFGVVVGEQIFGGHGYSFLDPPTAALAFLLFSFPGAAEAPNSPAVALAALAGGALLLATGLASWRVLLGAAAGLFAWLAVKGYAPPFGEELTSALALGMVYLVAEPVSAAATNPGRWAYGLLAGMLVVLLGAAGAGPGSTASVVFAALLAGTFAPLIDRIVILLNVRQRRRRNGRP
jgi:Na+-transporting NADH:ubiquinone oxidoreductase subunit B